jgi:2-keto-3-deoxy-L-rhamnonate aldolase RhmA
LKPNSLRARLGSSAPTVGTHLFLTDPAVVEIVAQTGTFDYLELLAEYSAYDLRALDEFCRAAELHGLGTMVKLDFECHRFFAQRSVGAGFESVLFADARSAEDVRDFVRTLKPDTPEHGGLFGVGARRHARPAYGGKPEYVAALDDVVIAVMIEKRPAVEEIGEIVRVPGIDLVQFGPFDYAMSIGRPGDAGHPDVRAAERHVIETCAAAGIPCRAEIASAAEAGYYLDLGVRHFSVGYDLVTLHDALKEAGDRLRAAISSLT